MTVTVWAQAIPALAEPPGTIGHLYQDCKAALENSKSFEAFYQTHCGAFVEGYAVGVMAAGAAEFRNSSEKDSCWHDREKSFNHINGRFCPNLPKFDDSTADPAYMFRNVAKVVQRWITFGGKEALKRDVLDGSLNDMLRPGPFCEELLLEEETEALKINPGLLKNSSVDILTFRHRLLRDDKLAQCKADLEQAKGSDKAFRGTRCGAQIEGFLLGVRWTDFLQDTRPGVSKSCAKEIGRLYKTLDAEGSMCVSKKTKPLDIARIYVNNNALLKAAQGSGWMSYFKPGTVNSIGYDVVYKGFLCVEKR